MKIAIGSDHAGYGYKEALEAHLVESGRSVLDLGTHSADSTDYPDYAHAVAKAVEEGRPSLECSSAAAPTECV